MKTTSTLKEILETMGNISESEFQKMPKTMQRNYDAICRYLEKKKGES